MGKCGLFNKYEVKKQDGSEIDPNAVYFVLRLDTDPAARKAAWLYQYTCESGRPMLAADLRVMLLDLERKDK